MPWLRLGDTSAFHPTLMNVVEVDYFDDRLVNELFGFLARCATQSAGFMTDYVVSKGTATSIAGASRVNTLLDAAVRAGVMEPVVVDGRRVFKIVEDDEFIHMRLKEEVEWDRQRKADNGNPELVIPVRLRDGDACRYCGRVVKWSDKKAGIGGTYDHREPGVAGTIETMVVACRKCNSSRRNDPLADKRLPLLPAPPKPYYSTSTVDWVNSHDWSRAHGITITKDRRKDVPPGTTAPGYEELVSEPQLLSLADVPEEVSTNHSEGVSVLDSLPGPGASVDRSPAPTPAAGAPFDVELQDSGLPTEWAVASADDGQRSPAPDATSAAVEEPTAAPEPSDAPVVRTIPTNNLPTPPSNPVPRPPAPPSLDGHTNNTWPRFDCNTYTRSSAPEPTFAQNSDTNPRRYFAGLPAKTRDLTFLSNPGQISANRQTEKSGYAGSGRDGTGGDGSRARDSGHRRRPETDWDASPRGRSRKKRRRRRGGAG